MSKGMSRRLSIAPQRSTSEGRRAHRYTMRRPIVIHAGQTGQAESASGQLQDYSATGVGFTARSRLAPGQEFVLNLIARDGGRIPLKFTVVHCEAEGHSDFRVGARRIMPVHQPSETPIPVRQALPPLGRPAAPETISTDVLPASQARGFVRGTTLDGKTVCGWERQLDLRREGNRIWLNMHPPGKTAGWGMFVDRSELIGSIEALVEGSVGAFKLCA